MDISEQKKTYSFFGKLILWGSVGVVVDDVPKSLDLRGVSSQSVIFPDLNIHLDIAFNGPVPYLPI